MKPNAPTCPICGNPANKLNTVYGTRYECHGLWSWGEVPLSDKETHELRKLAHAKFDPIWRSGKMNRSKAYAVLANTLRIPVRKCHMKLMGKKLLKRVLTILEEEEKKWKTQ